MAEGLPSFIKEDGEQLLFTGKDKEISLLRYSVTVSRLHQSDLVKIPPCSSLLPMTVFVVFGMSLSLTV